MPFTETLEALGSWELELAEETPADTLAKVGYFGHLVLIDGPVDVDATGNALLAAARYVGVCQALAKPNTYKRSGSGLLTWIGDADGKGHTILTEISLTNATLAQVVAALLPPTVTVGTVYPQANPATRYTGKHVFQSRRDALKLALAPFGAELRVNGNFTVDVGTPAQLYDTVLPLTTKPSPMIVRKSTGSDIDLAAVGGKVETEGAVWDFSTGIRVMGQTIGTGDEPDTTFVIGSADAASVPWQDPQGNPVKLVRLISASSETQGSAPATAQLNLNRFNRATSAIKVTADDYEISGGFGVGDASFVYDPDSGILDPANQVIFRGEVIHPAIVRVSSLTSPIVEGMTVAWRTDAGVWIDLTRWVVWESTSSREITVGDLPKSLTKPADPIQDRVDAARGNPSTKVPKTPTGLTLTTASSLNAAGDDSSVISAAWDPVTQYVDNTTVALHHYEVQYRPQFRSPLWTASLPFGGTSGDLPVTARLVYDVQVRAVSTGGIPSAWSSTQSLLSAADSTAPAAPADPVLTQSLGQIRVRYPGINNVGGPMPADANRVEVEVASAGSGGPFVTESSLNPFIEGIHRVGGTPGQTRWVRLRAFDHNGNPSAYSATVSAVIPQVQDGELAGMSVGKLLAGTVSADIVIAGRFTTALTGARREVNALGFQAFDASNNLMINLDGVNNLLTGRFQTALSGRRISIGASGANGRINFFAPDGSLLYLDGFTASSGVEAMRIGADVAGDTGPPLSSLIVQNNESSFITGRTVTAVFGGYSTGTRSFGVDYAPNKADMNVSRSPRLTILPDSTSFYVPTAGDFWVTESATNAPRLHVDGDGNNNFFAPNHFFNPSSSIGTVADRGWAVFNPGQRVGPTSGGYVDSYELVLATPAISGSNYGGRLKFAINNDLTSGGLEMRNSIDTGYTDCRAWSFTAQSSELGKVDIQDLEGSLLDRIRPIRAKRFRQKERPATGGRGQQLLTVIGPDGVRTQETPLSVLPGLTQFGVIAEEMPAEMLVPALRPEEGPGVSLTAGLALALGALAEIAPILDQLRGDVALLKRGGTP